MLPCQVDDWGSETIEEPEVFLLVLMTLVSSLTKLFRAQVYYVQNGKKIVNSIFLKHQAKSLVHIYFLWT